MRVRSSWAALALISASFACISSRRVSRSPLRHAIRYWDAEKPPTPDAIIKANTKSTGPRRDFRVIGWPRPRISLPQDRRSWIRAGTVVAPAPIIAARIGSGMFMRPS